jgi:hypothetical protein
MKRWTTYRMVTRERAEAVARALNLAMEVRRDEDCFSEEGRTGLPCRVCAYNRREWRRQVGRVRLAMKRAFQ